MKNEGGYDYIIVGAGSAGCVLASRLSQDAESDVLLVEAGRVYTSDHFPSELKASDIVEPKSRFTWAYQGRHGLPIHTYDITAAKVGGGGSSINAGIVRRAREDDFLCWPREDTFGWSYEDILDQYRAIEQPISSSKETLKEGFLPVVQLEREQMSAALCAFVDSGVRQGFPLLHSFNAENQDGIGFETLNVITNVRHNTAMVYLTDDVRVRKNLTIVDETQVDQLLFDGRRAAGIRSVRGKVYSAAREVVLCSGAYGSPILLLRSGVGPAEHLSQLGRRVVADLPVGGRLKDHPAFFSSFLLAKNVSAGQPARGAALAMRSICGTPDAAKGLDMWVFAENATQMVDGEQREILRIGSAVMKPLSEGSVRLRSLDPNDSPIINHNLLAELTDRDRLVEALKVALEIAQSSPLADMIERRLEPPPEAVDEVALQKAVQRKLQTFYHGCCTVPMGLSDDPRAVTDSAGRVRGLEGLRVVDASIFPDIISVPLNLTVIMVAERIAKAIRAGT